MGQGAWFHTKYDHFIMVDEDFFYDKEQNQVNSQTQEKTLWQEITTAFEFANPWTRAMSFKELNPECSPIYVPPNFVPKQSFDRFTLGIHSNSDSYIIAAIPHLYEASPRSFKAYRIGYEMQRGFNHLIRQYSGAWRPFRYPTSAYTSKPYGYDNKGKIWTLYQHAGHEFNNQQSD